MQVETDEKEEKEEKEEEEEEETFKEEREQKKKDQKQKKKKKKCETKNKPKKCTPEPTTVATDELTTIDGPTVIADGTGMPADSPAIFIVNTTTPTMGNLTEINMPSLLMV